MGIGLRHLSHIPHHIPYSCIRPSDYFSIANASTQSKTTAAYRQHGAAMSSSESTIVRDIDRLKATWIANSCALMGHDGRGISKASKHRPMISWRGWKTQLSKTDVTLHVKFTGVKSATSTHLARYGSTLTAVHNRKFYAAAEAQLDASCIST
jgi:hypothetical protein